MNAEQHRKERNDVDDDDDDGDSASFSPRFTELLLCSIFFPRI